MLDLVEESLDEVALSIEREVTRALLLAVGLCRDDGGDVALFECLDERVGVVTFVGDDRAGLKSFEQWLCLGNVGRLSGRERRRDRIAERIDDGVDPRPRGDKPSSSGRRATGRWPGLRRLF
jgi:hypothetical protein